MFRRKSTFFLIYMGALIGVFSLLCGHALLRQRGDLALLQRKGEVVKRLQLTDLCLFTDARYTRHPSMTDLNTPFQDYPMAFDFFPSGSLLPPPPHITGGGK